MSTTIFDDASLTDFFEQDQIDVLSKGAKSFVHGSYSPYAVCHLARNPFGEMTRAERAGLAQIDLERCLSAIQTERSALQIIGPCGHGKTTHLLGLQAALPDSSYVYFPEEGTQPPWPKGRPLLVDEAQRVGWWRWWQLLRRPGPLVLATHVDVSARLERAGYTVQTLDLSGLIAPELLCTILNARIEYCRLHNLTGSHSHETMDHVERHPLLLTVAQAKRLQNRFGADVRAMEEYLYTLIQSLSRTADSSNELAPTRFIDRERETAR